MRRLLRRRSRLRLPQDVLLGGDPPDLARFPDPVDRLVQDHAQALASGDHEARAGVLWGLVARGEVSLPWCREALDSGDSSREVRGSGA